MICCTSFISFDLQEVFLWIWALYIHSWLPKIPRTIPRLIFTSRRQRPSTSPAVTTTYQHRATSALQPRQICYREYRPYEFTFMITIFLVSSICVLWTVCWLASRLRVVVGQLMTKLLAQRGVVKCREITRLQQFMLFSELRSWSLYYRVPDKKAAHLNIPAKSKRRAYVNRTAMINAWENHPLRWKEMSQRGCTGRD